MPDARLPVLWLYGPPGGGKTTVAWELRRAAHPAGAQAAALESASLGDLRVDTTGQPVQDIAAKVLLEAGWPLGLKAGA